MQSRKFVVYLLSVNSRFLYAFFPSLLIAPIVVLDSCLGFTVNLVTFSSLEQVRVSRYRILIIPLVGMTLFPS